MGSLPDVSKLMKNEVISVMTIDDITDQAINDKTILALGEEVLCRNIDNETRRMYYASQRMRDASCLLFQLKELSGEPNLTMWDALRPHHFENMVQGALNLAMPKFDDEDDLKSPSYAIKIKYDLHKMAHYKRMTAMKKLDHDSKRDDEEMRVAKHQAKELLYCLSPQPGASTGQWAVRVTRLARKVLKDRQDTSRKDLPKPSDMKNLSDFLITSLKGLTLDRDQVDWEMYNRVEKLKGLCVSLA